MTNWTLTRGRLEYRDRTGYIELEASEDIPPNRVLVYDREFFARLAREGDGITALRKAGSVKAAKKGEMFEAVGDGWCDIEVKDRGKMACMFYYHSGALT